MCPATPRVLFVPVFDPRGRGAAILPMQKTKLWCRNPSKAKGSDKDKHKVKPKVVWQWQEGGYVQVLQVSTQAAVNEPSTQAAVQGFPDGTIALPPSSLPSPRSMMMMPHFNVPPVPTGMSAPHEFPAPVTELQRNLAA